MTARLQVESATVADSAIELALDGDRLAHWTLPRDPYRPSVLIARDAAGITVAAVLTSARPATAAVKIVDVWWTDEQAAAGLVERVIDEASARGDVAVKWEVPAGSQLPAFAAALGFAQMRRPLGAVGTGSADGAVHGFDAVSGHVRWLAGDVHAEPGYYAQTTMFTCGAVAALIASEDTAAGGFEGSDADRDVEVGFWRRASNYPACEPIGLAVALRQHLGALPVEVALDADGPVLLEGLSGFDHSFRAELQQDSRRQADELGIPVRRDRVGIDELVRRVAGGERALLLIDEAPMHGEVGPHWIVAHAVAGDAVVVEDPWISVDAGETWVDAHELPIRPADLDRLVRWADDGYRGVVFTRPS